jgi:hypothetical protein
MFLYDIVTPSEVESIFDLPEGSVRRDISRGKFRQSEIRKSGAIWLITKREALRVYKNELTMIPVVDDWDWVFAHVKDELENPVFNQLVRKVLNKPFMGENDVRNLADLYHDGLREGMEDGKYIPFAQWFYEFYEDRIFEIENEEEEKPMQEQFYALLEEMGKTVNDEKASVSFNDYSIDITDILEDGTNGYGHKFYSATEAVDYLKSCDALE